MENFHLDILDRRGDLYRTSIQVRLEAYIQSIVLKKTVEVIFFDRRRELQSRPNTSESWEMVNWMYYIYKRYMNNL
ncbi:hypothetical protein CWI38_0294p0010 [Hamiltosporidium tvaerminnensis]|uniref:Uncharacterized protein n=1 Tax=Hamiltosporidium tvaerminnensis TaxID=1176355 RepID=A0A4Q9M144_9MICR|nr:hypothetical protein CWI38_0294p0010 [Hamiltosporidium tvaerminnensis]